MAAIDVELVDCCSVCLRVISVTSAGLIHQHGPCHSRPGARQPPVSCRLMSSQQECTSATSTLNSTPQDPFSLPTLSPKCSVQVLKGIPRASQCHGAEELSKVLLNVVSLNNDASWNCLSRFTARCFHVPEERIKNRSLASEVNQQLNNETDPPQVERKFTSHRKRKPQDTMCYLASQVSAKLEEGDFRGAIRLVCYEDSIAPQSESIHCP